MNVERSTSNIQCKIKIGDKVVPNTWKRYRPGSDQAKLHGVQGEVIRECSSVFPDYVYVKFPAQGRRKEKTMMMAREVLEVKNVSE